MSDPTARPQLRGAAPRAVILDLDGTLVDTAEDLAVAANAMRAQCGLPPLPTARIVAFVGKGVDVLVHRAITDAPDGRLDDARFRSARAMFLEHYHHENGRHSRPYANVEAGLDAMLDLGLVLGCCTNKPAAFTVPLLEQTGLAPRLQQVVCGDTLPNRKPHPEPLLYIAERFGLSPSEVLVIGDSENDALAARAANMPVWLVPYGYREGMALEDIDADGVVADLLEASRWMTGRMAVDGA